MIFRLIGNFFIFSAFLADMRACAHPFSCQVGVERCCQVGIECAHMRASCSCQVGVDHLCQVGIECAHMRASCTCQVGVTIFVKLVLSAHTCAHACSCQVGVKCCCQVGVECTHMHTVMQQLLCSY